MLDFFKGLKSHAMPKPEDCLPDNDQEILISAVHHVNQQPMKPPFAKGFKSVVLGMGCFWGAERRFWQQPGVIVTAAGYAGGYTKHPTYEQTCSGLTGHTEVVLVVYDPSVTSLADLLEVFWQSHDPTQGMRQGNDMGSQYRSALFTYDEDDLREVTASREQYQQQLSRSGYGEITTEIKLLDHFYYAEEYHQQYLSKNPNGYCGLAGTGVCYS